MGRMESGIANILHRGTIAVLAGTQTFDRGQRCFADGRVVEVEGANGELRGVVKPADVGRAAYVVRLWIRSEGLAYECTCPIGSERRFCKHNVAIALAHLERERADAERGLDVLREALGAIPAAGMIDGLLILARRDPVMADALKRMCLDALSRS